MSYCRFENTSIDMDSCIEALINRDATSKNEVMCAIGMFRNILNTMVAEGVIQDFNEKHLEQICNEMLDPNNI